MGVTGAESRLGTGVTAAEGGGGSDVVEGLRNMSAGLLFTPCAVLTSSVKSAIFPFVVLGNSG